MGRRKQKDLRNGINSASIKSSEESKLTTLVDNLLRVTTAPIQPNVNKALDLQIQIAEIVKEIQALENSRDKITSPSFRSDGATIHQFLNWLNENGAEFEGIEIANFPGYELGLQAKKDLNESSLIISVPRKIMLTTESVSGTPLGSIIQKDALLNNMSNVALTLVLLFEKFKDDSFWKPYIDVLPVNYSTVLYFTYDELKELKGSSVLETALKQIRNICRQYAYLHKMIWTSENPSCKLLKKYFTFNQYRWAASTVMTRQNTVPSEDGNYLSALIPLWDLCNHMNGSITTDYNPELRRSECFALKDFKQNDQIFIFYGARNNADLFIHNGFVYEDNIHDGYWLKLGISKNDPLRGKRIQLLEKLSINTFDFLIRKGPEPIDGDLLAFLRVFSMDNDTLENYLKVDGKVDSLKLRECKFDSNLQTKCWEFLQTRLKLLLSAYKYSSDENTQLVNGTQMSENMQLSIRMREIEKHLLRNVLTYVEQQL
ncbi:histone-lysine N-methyltransferase setd3 [Agrilus planipennis]|uniref:protein-histidine N-methyltransferase n=1 Tax=Agrilus planipennis TaxID=224129 RepID=A0A1W4XMC6_AGRPL|nr:histone-lysine N-methyltransferase setd3 [Agrilus planipennis]XP_025830070.1 histone-lysine N-methyltransferase setd3 [Agrilus planipennis]